MLDPNQIINGAIGAAGMIIVALITYLGVQRIVAKADAKDKEASARGKDADATKRLQEVVAGMGDLYGDLVEHVRESVEAQIKLEYAERIERLEREQAAWLEERREWEIGIGMLLAQIGEAQLKPRWKPRAMATGPLTKPAAEAHGFQS